MDASELDYALPDAAIAQRPVEPRDAARLLVAGRSDAEVEHRTVADLPALVGPGDVLVVNDTKVLPARLKLRKATGGAVEVLLLERIGLGRWEALVRPSRRVAEGAVLVPVDDAGTIRVEVGAPLHDGSGARTIEIHAPEGDLAALAAIGEVPLPPYIHEPIADPSRYQTVFANEPGSVAAPTAGLHLTSAVLDGCRAAGATVATVDLHVGLGTFRPIATDRVEDHPMHAERYRVPPATVAALEQRSGRVLAVGTTVVRTLESWARTGEVEGATDLFIHGEFDFRAVDRLLTNFHVPRSSLLALVQSFAGRRWRELYATALAEGYRFLSFGDAMLLERERSA